MKWIRTALCALGMLACLSLSAFAAELGEPNITEQTTMKELRENPSIKGSGFLHLLQRVDRGQHKIRQHADQRAM